MRSRIKPVVALLPSLLAAACHSTATGGRDVSAAVIENRPLGTDLGVPPCAVCPGSSSSPRRARLEDTDWKFIQFGDQTTNGSLVSGDIYLRLRSPGSGMRLFDGCNVIFGRYELRGYELRFRVNGITDWACSEASDKQRRLLETLQASVTWNILGETLQLYDSGNKVLAQFEAQAVR